MPGYLITLVALLGVNPLGPGDHTRTVEVAGHKRTYRVHVPPYYEHQKPTPLVLVFHGAATNGKMIAGMSHMSDKADEANFIVAYPNGTGFAGLALAFNAGMTEMQKRFSQTDDVEYVRQILDDLPTVLSIDRRRVFAAGHSNGGMMCYRLATELPDRIAAIASISGTMTYDEPRPSRPVPVLHFHGTEDKVVPYDGPNKATGKVVKFKSVGETIRAWATANGCPTEAAAEFLPAVPGDPTSVTRRRYGPGKDGAEVILYTIHGGGHTWPGQKPPVPILGRSTKTISANDLMWEFFQEHPLK